jgi:hypothetical protein
MEIVCIRSIVRTANAVVWTRQALIWKLRPAKSVTVRTRLNLGKIFNEIWKVDRTVVRPDGA